MSSLDEELLRVEQERLEKLQELTQRQKRQAEIEAKVKVEGTVEQKTETEVTVEGYEAGQKYRTPAGASYAPGATSEDQRRALGQKASDSTNTPASEDEKPDEGEEEPDKDNDDKDKDEDKEDEDDENKDKDEDDNEEKDDDEDDEDPDKKDKDEDEEPDEEKKGKEGEDEPGENPESVGPEDAAEGAGKVAEAEVGAAETAEVAESAEATAAIVGTSEFWIPAVAIILGILLIIGLTMFVAGSMVAICNQPGMTGTALRAGSTLTSGFGYFSEDICKQLAINNNGGRGGGGGASGSWSLDIVLTSAYRPGPPSADSRGETADIALRNPTGSADPRIAQLVQLVESVGFTPPKGYNQNEYTNPSAHASGGHIHIQFNLNSATGKTYCDDTVPKYPPTDLVDLGSIPTLGITPPNLPKVRPCMLTKLQAIFSAAASGP